MTWPHACPFTPALFLFLILALTGPAPLSVPPAAYYEPAEGKLGEELREALADIIGGHTRVSYSWPPFYLLDQDPDNTDNVLLVYSGFSKPHDSHHLVWNREHLWPRSRGARHYRHRGRQ